MYVRTCVPEWWWSKHEKCRANCGRILRRLPGVSNLALTPISLCLLLSLNLFVSFFTLSSVHIYIYIPVFLPSNHFCKRSLLAVYSSLRLGSHVRVVFFILLNPCVGSARTKGLHHHYYWKPSAPCFVSPSRSLISSRIFLFVSPGLWQSISFYGYSGQLKLFRRHPTQTFAKRTKLVTRFFVSILRTFPFYLFSFLFFA